VKTMTGKKVALLVPVSDEVVSTNPAGLYDQLQSGPPTAISRAFDYAAINGKSIKHRCSAGPFSDYLALASNTVALGTAAQGAGGLYTDIVTGAGKVVDKNYDFTGIAADPRFKIDAQLATDTTGRPLFLGNDSPAGVGVAGNLAGYPAAFNKGVSGKYWRAGDSVQTSPSAAPHGRHVHGVLGWQLGYVAAYNVAASTLQGAIQAWGGIYTTVTVSGTAGTPYTITFPAITSNVSRRGRP
jgi:hypothetical protein